MKNISDPSTWRSLGVMIFKIHQSVFRDILQTATEELLATSEKQNSSMETMIGLTAELSQNIETLKDRTSLFEV